MVKINATHVGRAKYFGGVLTIVDDRGVWLFMFVKVNELVMAEQNWNEMMNVVIQEELVSFIAFPLFYTDTRYSHCLSFHYIIHLLQIHKRSVNISISR